ncbi:MAG: AMP-binding protein [SAR324 cluster bacterium]|nr:AMP-binding protein [SAR324 cluster bacterium]
MLGEFIVENKLALDNLFDRYAEQTAFVGPGLRLSYLELKKQILLAGTHLKTYCHSPGMRIGLYAENPVLYPILMQAAWQIGAVFIPFNIRAPLDSLRSIINPDLLITDQPVLPDRTTSVIHPDCLFIATQAEKRSSGRLNSLDLEAEASVILTSGSSGTPKGVVHTVGNYLYSAWGTIDYLSASASDSWLVSLPLFHVGGLVICIRTLLSGALAILPGNNRELEAPIKAYQLSFLSLVPTQLMRFLEKPEMTSRLKECRGILLGGAAAPEWLIRRAFRQGVPVLPTYGSTESCAQATGVDIHSPEQDRLTSGKPLRFRTVRLDTDQCIIISGKTIFKHYLTRDGKPEVRRTKEFKTTDLGRFDGSGNLKVLGRSDQIFQSGGENINPFEIEEILTGLPGIHAAVVVPVHHAEFGQVPWAFVHATIPLKPEKIKQALRKCIPPYKIPKEICEMPVDDGMNAMKPDRRKLAQVAAQMQVMIGENS